MEKFVRQTMLYDFYGELLTKHQQQIFEAVVFNDIGYSEAAQQEGITRQGVHDLIRRCDQQLEHYDALTAEEKPAAKGGKNDKKADI